ncbi:tumor necrosis factor receptor superfamily member 27-like [Crassostrea angulata]|uniref:tumor necrosis factor receptor superfamily member 27-like n=1 Tax=Magallana angulata TaxID=2784310 RepID=UPI0022B10360|nr:tumor necrosis factor receptor superfamily member 27-like [Crassostrea angulata]
MLSFKVLILLFMVWSIQGVGGKPMCDPEDHKYYHTQADTCLQCEECLQGEEAISLEDWNIEHSDPEKGPTECRLCRKCQSGTYSDKRSYKCEPCRNCTLYNQYQVSQCTATSDTVCDGVRPTTPRQNITKTTKLDPEKQHENDDDSNDSITITGMICTTVFVLILILFVYLSLRKFCCNKENERKVDSEVIKSTSSDLSKDVKIDMELDLQPLLQKSCESQFEKKPIELQTLGANPDEMDLLHDTCSSNNKTKQGDLETDGPPEISPTKIQKEGQLSNLNDERLKTDSPQELPQDHPMPATAQTNSRLTEGNLWTISKELVSGHLFLAVARDFKMEEADIEAVKIDNEKYSNVRETSYQMLLLITKKRGKITFHELKNSLQKHDRKVYEKVLIALDQAGSNEP